MVRLAANLSTMFNEVPFLERFDAAADNGFKAVEFMFPYEAEADEVAARAKARALQTVLFNCPAGDWAGGDRGLGALPDRIDECRAGVEKAIEYAKALSCSKLHFMAGAVPPEQRTEEHERVYIENAQFAADLVAKEGIELLVEAINTRVDVPNYFINSSAEAMRLIERIGRPNVKFQYDIYHMQVMEGDLARRIETLLPSIAHIQLADNPGRNEPGSGEIDYPWLLNHIDALGYSGWIGCEYKPQGKTVDGLAWAKPYL